MISGVQHGHDAILTQLVRLPLALLDCWEDEQTGSERTIAELVQKFKDIVLIPPSYRLKHFPDCTIERYYAALRKAYWESSSGVKMYGHDVKAQVIHSPAMALKFYLAGQPHLTWRQLMGTA